MIKLYICCLVLIIGSVEVGLDIDMKFHQEVMEIVSYDITKGNGIWAHFVSTGYFPSQIQLLRPIQKDDVQIETICCIFKCIRINWSSINVAGIPGTIITMPDTAYVSIFTTMI